MGRRRRGLMSEQFKNELAKDLGIYETVMREGWEGIRTKDAGNLVKRAIQIAEEKLARDYTQQQPQSRLQTQQPSQQQPYQGAWQAAPLRQQPSSRSYAVAAVPTTAYGAHGASRTQQPEPQQPAYGYSPQTGFDPAHPGFVPQVAAEAGSASTYLT